MNEVKFYLSLFLRRLHYFLLVSVVVSAVAVIAAMSLPPAYESQTRLLVEGPQIPRELASSTVNIGEREQLEIIRQRLMTRANLLDVARSQNVFEDLGEMSADEIVDAMRARTNIRTGGGRGSPAIMTLTFEARRAAATASVLNEYLTLIEQQNAELRSSRAGTTLEFFQQEVERLGNDLDAQSARILEFKSKNAEALPENLQVQRQDQRRTAGRAGPVDHLADGFDRVLAPGRVETAVGVTEAVLHVDDDHRGFCRFEPHACW